MKCYQIECLGDRYCTVYNTEEEAQKAIKKEVFYLQCCGKYRVWGANHEPIYYTEENFKIIELIEG